MDFVKSQIQRIQQQLAGLTASQRMLTVALVAVMVMTLLYWGRYAGTAEMEPLLDQSFTQQDLGRVQSYLGSKGIKYENSGDRILVPAERKMELLADLAFARLLPQSTETGFDKMTAKLNPFAPSSEREQLYNRGKEITCGQVISRFPGVEDAIVMIDPTNKRHVGANIEPSATINITMSAGTPGGISARQVAEAAAMTVAGAQAGLPLSRINVTVNGALQRLRDPNSDTALGSDEQFEARQKYALQHEKDVLELLDYIVGLRVKVSVDVNTDRVNVEEEKFGEIQSKAVETETDETETSDGAGPDEPGAVPNVTANGELAVGEGGNGGGGQRSRQEINKDRNALFPDRTRTTTSKAPGKPTVVSASVRVPRSYLLNALKAINPDAPTPDGKAIDAYFAAELKTIEKDVRAATGMGEAGEVAVTTFVDAFPTLAAGASLPQTATMSVPVMIGSHGKEIALAGLALVALFMLMMMVKRSAPAPSVVAAAISAPAQAPGPLVAGEMLAGEAGDGNTTLAGMELDEDAVQTQQMLDQVSTMVKDNPDAAASLVKRWLNRD